MRPRRPLAGEGRYMGFPPHLHKASGMSGMAYRRVKVIAVPLLSASGS